MRQGGSSSNYPPRSGYDELDTTLMPPRPGEHFSGGGGGGGPGAPPAGTFVIGERRHRRAHTHAPAHALTLTDTPSFEPQCFLQTLLILRTRQVRSSRKRFSAQFKLLYWILICYQTVHANGGSYLRIRLPWFHLRLAVNSSQLNSSLNSSQIFCLSY